MRRAGWPQENGGKHRTDVWCGCRADNLARGVRRDTGLREDLGNEVIDALNDLYFGCHLSRAARAARSANAGQRLAQEQTQAEEKLKLEEDKHKERAKEIDLALVEEAGPAVATAAGTEQQLADSRWKLEQRLHRSMRLLRELDVGIESAGSLARQKQ